MNSPLHKRLTKEISSLVNDDPTKSKHFIFESLDINERSVIGRLLPESELYGKGSYRIKILYPVDYPFKQPSATFLTKIDHPNIDNNGKICPRKITEREWIPTCRITDVIEFLIDLIDNLNLHEEKCYSRPAMGICCLCSQYKQRCVKTPCNCGRRGCIGEYTSDLLRSSNPSMVCCKYKYQSCQLIGEHQCTLDDVQVSNCYIRKWNHASGCIINIDATHQYRHDQHKFRETVKEYVENYALPRTDEHVLNLRHL